MLFLTISGESNQPKDVFQVGEVFGVSRLLDDNHSEKYREIIIQTDAPDSEHWCCGGDFEVLLAMACYALELCPGAHCLSRRCCVPEREGTTGSSNYEDDVNMYTNSNT